MAWPKGKPRPPGAGKPKGYKAPATLDKLMAREAHRQLVTAALVPMTQAQIAHAQGVSYMILRHPDGTFTRATDVDQVDAACAAGAAAFQIFTQQPNQQAYAYLVDQAIDKAPQHQVISGPDGKPLEIIIKKPWAEE